MDRINSNLVKALPLGIIVYRIDPKQFKNTTIEKCNDIAHEIIGPVMSSIIGKTIKEARIPSHISEGVRTAYTTERPVGLDETRLKDMDIPGWFHIKFFKMPDSNQVVETIEDITNIISTRRQIDQQDIQYQNQLENLIKDRTSQLEHSNQALQSFVYAFSHDLREPLTKVVAFGTRLKETQKNLDDKGKEYVDVMVKAAERLSQLIDDLLSFSRMGEKDQTPASEVDTQRILQEIISDLTVSIEKNDAEIHIQPELPNIFAHPMRVRQVFQNLISNGLKFHKTNQTPIVHINGKIEDGYSVFTVRDEGIGFDPEFEEKIFNVFIRLHSRFEYPGTGLGLALCRRILSLYGGSITVRGEPGKGSIFTIKFPSPLE